MSYRRITINILKLTSKLKDEGEIMNFDKIIDAYQLPHNEPYVVPLGEFVTSYYAIEPLLKYIKSNSTNWCPFDTDESSSN